MHEPGQELGKRVLGRENRMSKDFQMRTNLNKNPI